ncbi:MAG: translation initiation factor IF-2 [bacterium]|nr:MAG: translation initiation factor IF-2 [bacterium]
MAEAKKIVRLSKAAREFNISMNTIIEFLEKKGFKMESSPNTKLASEMYELLINEFQAEKAVKESAHKKGLEFIGKETISIEDTLIKEKPVIQEEFVASDELFIANANVDFDTTAKAKKEEVIPHEEEEKAEPEIKGATTEKPEKEKIPETEELPAVKAEPEKEQPAAEKEAEPIPEKEVVKPEEEKPTVAKEQKVSAPEEKGIKIMGKIDLKSLNQKTRPTKKTKAERKKDAIQKKTKNQQRTIKKQEKPAKTTPTEEIKSRKAEEKTVSKDDNFIPTKFKKLTGPKIVDKIILPEKKKPVASSSGEGHNKKKRRRIDTRKKSEITRDKSFTGKGKHDRHQKAAHGHKKVVKHEPTEEEIQKQIKETLARLAPTGKSKSSKYRRQKRENISHAHEEELKKQKQEQFVLKVTEFLTANELANMMNINVNDIIKTCMQIGLFVSINQRLDAETISLLAGEYGYKVNFVDVENHESLDVKEEEDDPSKLMGRAPIVTVMGHVDHGKTKLLDYIRKANVVAGEAGGITQHIGAYEVTTANNKNITFLDTPGHEAFTAMRARGAKVTDVAIIVIAADDNVMPQTKEAINHAQAAGVPIVFALNKIDKPTANVDKIKEELAGMNVLVEDWGGKYQSQDISAVTGQGVQELLEKVLLEAEMLELKANPDKSGKGTVIEASLDKGRGYVSTILVQDGTITKGDILIAGPVFGHVKAMFNERGESVKSAGPSTPVLLLGLNGAPQAGDTFNVLTDEKEAKTITTKRQQLIREQSMRSQKHITLDEIGRRIAIGDFKELNIIVKGDVDGSVEALSDALLKLSTEETKVNIIHKAVGAITESDILLASASDAIVIGFQVRPMPQARKLAEKEQIDIRLYSIIYKATEELETAIEGMLAPKMEEKVTCNLEVRETFKITKVGTIAGCYVMDGKINRNTRVRLIRDGIVVYTGNLGSLKRFKDDMKEVAAGYECGLNIENFNDIKVGDIIEGFEEVEVARKK